MSHVTIWVSQRRKSQSSNGTMSVLTPCFSLFASAMCLIFFFTQSSMTCFMKTNRRVSELCDLPFVFFSINHSILVLPFLTLKLLCGMHGILSISGNNLKFGSVDCLSPTYKYPAKCRQLSTTYRLDTEFLEVDFYPNTVDSQLTSIPWGLLDAE